MPRTTQRKLRFSAILAGLVATLITGGTHAQVVAEHLPVDGRIQGSDGQIFADNFVLSSTAVVGRIGFWLTTNSDFQGTVFIWEDDGTGEPGSLVLMHDSASSPPLLTGQSVPCDSETCELVEYDVSDMCLTLNAGTPYWIGLTGSMIEISSDSSLAIASADHSWAFSTDAGATWTVIEQTVPQVEPPDLSFRIIRACAADFIGPGQTPPDGLVGIDDFLGVLSAWGTPGGDTDGDGNTGITDFLNVLTNWGACSCP